MFRLLFVALAAINLTLASGVNNGCPVFRWISSSKSEHGIPLLNIRFPDDLEDDFAVMKKMKAASKTDLSCILEGHLMMDKNATVRITKGCEGQNTYEIEIHSNRLVYSAFKVTDGIVKPSISKDTKTVGKASPKPKLLPFPEHGFSLKLIAIYDKSFKSKFSSLSKDVVRTIVEESKGLLTLPSLTVAIVPELIEFKEVNNTITSSNFKLDGIFQSNNTSSEDLKNINAVIFFTGESNNELLKTQKTGFICSTNFTDRAAIVGWKGSIIETSKIFAHEIGHLLGMGDDFTLNPSRIKILTRSDNYAKDCTSINGIMDFTSDRTVWSTCSSQDFANYYTTVKSKDAKTQFCLKENSQISTGFTKIAVALGSTDQLHEYLNTIEVVDLSSANTKCQNLPTFPYPNYRTAGILGSNNIPIICGGLEEDQKACFSLVNGTWTRTAYMKGGRGIHQMTKSPFPNKGSIFVAGGINVVGDKMKTTEVLTESGWQLSTPLPVEMSHHCMVLLNPTTVMAIGGTPNVNSFERTGDTYLLNGETNTWAKGPALIQARTHHTCAMIRKDEQSKDKSIIVVGGTQGQDIFRSTEVLDTRSSQWRNGPQLPYGIQDASMVEDSTGGVVLLGGFSKDKGFLKKIFRLSHAGSGASWEELPQQLQKPRQNPSVFLIPDSLTNCTKTN